MKRPGFQPRFIFGRPNPNATSPRPAHEGGTGSSSLSQITDSFITGDGLDEARARYGDVVRPYTIAIPEGVNRALTELSEVGNPLIVGGTVRDSLLGARDDVSDIDVEVHDSDLDDITGHLRSRGYLVDEVGKQFGVLKVHKPGVVDDLDVSVPRRENRTGAGHRSFDTELDATMTVEEATERRDFTMNAIMYDPRLGVLVDYHGGVEDVADSTLRHVSGKFSEDPLRVLRGFQFAGRFGMTLAPETAQLCRDIRDGYGDLSIERVQEEWSKFYRKSTDYHAGVRALKDSGWDETIPGLRRSLDDPGTVERLSRVSSVDPGDRVVCAASVISSGMSEGDREVFLSSTLVGKDPRRLVRSMVSVMSEDLSTAYQRKKIASDLVRSGFTFRQYLSVARVMGNFDHLEQARESIADGVGDGPEQDLVTGDDIRALTDRSPGPWMGEMISQVRDEQYRSLFRDRGDALARVRELLW